MKSIAMKSVLLGALSIASATYNAGEAKNDWSHMGESIGPDAKNDWKMDYKTDNVAAESKNDWNMDYKTDDVAAEAKNDWNMDHKTDDVAAEAKNDWNMDNKAEYGADMSYEAPQVDVEAAPEHKLEGAKDNEHVYVVSTNWGGDKGEMKVADASAGGVTHEV